MATATATSIAVSETGRSRFSTKLRRRSTALAYINAPCLSTNGITGARRYQLSLSMCFFTQICTKNNAIPARDLQVDPAQLTPRVPFQHSKITRESHTKGHQIIPITPDLTQQLPSTTESTTKALETHLKKNINFHQSNPEHARTRTRKLLLTHKAHVTLIRFPQAKL